MSIRPIIGTYDSMSDKTMSEPKTPTHYDGLEGTVYDRWITANRTEFTEALTELKSKIQHISYEVFKSALNITIKSFKSGLPRRFPCVALVQPGKSQKWVTEIAMSMGLKASAYACLGEEGANGLDYSLENISSKDRRFHNCIIVDDGSFSGNQMANNISAAHRILKTKFAVEPTFHILIPFITRRAELKINHLKSKGITVNLHSAVKMASVADAMSAKNLGRALEVLWPHQSGTKRLELASSSALYWFDHKIPNSMSFPEVLADGQVTQPKDKDDADNIRFIPSVLPPYKEVSKAA